jgi:CubicO group peptidase (beta-lactamase class C family)
MHGHHAVSGPLSAAVALLVLASPLRAQADFAGIDSMIEDQLRQGGVPGGALVIVHGDQVVHTRGFGVADGSGRKVTPETPFYLGSTTKSFTALAILDLVEEGRVDLDAPVQRYLPWFTLADSAFSRGITVRQLVMHSGGIPGRAGEYWLDDPDTSAAAAERHVRRLAKVRPVRGFQYSNANYVTLGLVVEAASGMSYPSYLRKRVLGPLDMRHTHTERADAERDGLSTGHRVIFGVPFATVQPADRGDLAAGYLISSAEDIGHYLAAQLSQGRVAGRQALSPHVIAEMHTPRGNIVPGTDLALGFVIQEIDGVKTLEIAGSVPAFVSRLILFPDSGWGVALLANANGIAAEGHVQDAAVNVARMVMGRPPVPVTFPLIFAVVLGVFMALPLLQLAGVLFSIRRFRRWTQVPASRPSTPRAWVIHAVLPALGGVALGMLLLVGLPFIFQSYLRIMRLFQPGLGWAITVSGWLALAWAGVRTFVATRYRPGRA